MLGYCRVGLSTTEASYVEFFSSVTSQVPPLHISICRIGTFCGSKSMWILSYFLLRELPELPAPLEKSSHQASCAMQHSVDKSCVLLIPPACPHVLWILLDRSCTVSFVFVSVYTFALGADFCLITQSAVLHKNRVYTNTLSYTSRLQDCSFHGGWRNTPKAIKINL